MANAKTIQELIIKLTTQTAELATGFQKADDIVKKFATAAKATLGAVSIAVIARTLEQGISDARKFAAEMSRMGEKIGIPTATLSKFADAADDTGVGIESLGMGFKFLSKSMFAAQQGSEEQALLFQELGVAAVDTVTGGLRPTEEVLYQLADAFAGMEDGAQKTAIAVQLFGRAGQEMIPFLNQGADAIRENAKEAEQFGIVIDDKTGKAARKFGRTVKDTGDAIKGLWIAAMKALLPIMQEAATATLNFATSLNSLKDSLPQIITGIRMLVAAGLVLLVAKIAAAVAASAWFAGAIGTLSFVMQNLGFVLAYVANSVKVAMMSFFATPIGPIIVTIAALAAAWEYLGAKTREAKAAQDQYLGAVKAMTFDELQINIVKMTNYISMMEGRIASFAAELEKAGEGASPFDAAKLDTWMKMLDDAKGRLAALQAQLAVDEKKKKGETELTAAATLKAVRDRTAQLKAEFASFVDPVEGARNAVNTFIEQTVGKAPRTTVLKKAIAELWGAFDRFAEAQKKRAVQLAQEKGSFDLSVAMWEIYLKELQAKYDLGLVDINTYYAERARIIAERAAAEIALLEAEAARTETSPQRKREIVFQIKIIGAKRDDAIRQNVEEEAKAWRELWAAVREGDLQTFLSKNQNAMDELQWQYDRGLIGLEEYFKRRKEIIAAGIDAEMKAISGAMMAGGMSDKDRAAAQAKLEAMIESRKGLLSREGRDQISEAEKTLSQKNQLELAYAQKAAESKPDSMTQMEAENAVQIAAMQERHRQELKEIELSAAQTFKIGEESVSKEVFLTRMAEAQKQTEVKKTADLDRQVLIAKLQIGQEMAAATENMFGNLYELSGKKIKAFFYLQKAASIAQAIMNTAEGVTKAMAQGGIWGYAQAAAITAMGATQVALIMQQTIKGAEKGGAITEGSGTKDDVLIRVMRGEYIIPKKAVAHYGVSAMEAIRRMVLPRDSFDGVGRLPVMTPNVAFATGGLATQGAGNVSNSISLPITISGIDASRGLAARLRDEVEDTVVRVLREQFA